MKSKIGGSNTVENSTTRPMSNLQPSMGNIFHIITFFDPIFFVVFLLFIFNIHSVC